MPVRKMLDDLKDLHRDFLALVRGAEEAMAGAVRVVREPDPNGGAVAVEDDSGTEPGRRIVWQAQRIVLLYQPVARDFCEVTAVLRTSAAWERIRALAVEVAACGADLAALPVSVPAELARLALAVFGMGGQDTVCNGVDVV